MISCRKQMLAAAAFAVLAAAAPAAADVKTGVDAWQAGNYDGAVKEWRPLAEKGDADAQFNMAQAYKLGRGVPADMRIAQSWYEKAAAPGHEQAQANLGLILFQSGNRSAAMPWIVKASDRGDPRAQYVLGTALFNGDLIGKDWPRAYALMSGAAASGLPQAATSLAEMDKYIPLTQRQQGLAMARTMSATPVQMASAASPAPMAKPMPKPTASAAVTEAPKAAPMPAVRTTPPAAKVSPLDRPMAARPVPTAKPVMPPMKPAPSATPAVKAAVAPAKAPAPAAKPAAVSASGRWKVQFGAFGDPNNAKRQWDVVSKKVSGLAGLQPMMAKAGAVTRLQAGPFADRAAADRICASAKAAGQPCFVTAQ